MKKLEKSRQIQIISYINSFILSILIAVICILPLFYIFVLSPDRILYTMERSYFYTKVQIYSMESASDILTPTGVENSILEGAFSVTDIQSIVNNTMDGTSGDEAKNATMEHVKNVLKENIYTFISNSEIPENEVAEEAIDEIVQALADDFENNLTLPFVAQLHSIQATYRTFMPVALIGSVVISAGIALLLLKLNHWKHRAIRYYAYSCGGASLMLLLIPLALRVWGGYERVGLSPEFLYDFFVLHVHMALNTFIVCGVVLIIITVLLCILSEKLRHWLTK